MKYYVITSGEYSDYHIIGVTSDRSKAILFCKTFNRLRRLANSYDYRATLKEFDELDCSDSKYGIFLNEAIKGKNFYRVEKTINFFGNKEHSELTCEAHEPDSLFLTSEKYPTYCDVTYWHSTVYLERRYLTYVWAKNEEDARKIGADRIAKKQAEVELECLFEGLDRKIMNGDLGIEPKGILSDAAKEGEK